MGGGKVRVQERATGMMRGLEQLPDSERLTEVRLLQARKFVALQTPMERAPWDVLAIVRYSSDPQHLPSHRKWPIDVGTLPAPRLFLDRLSAHEGDTAMLSCLVPCGIPVTRIVFCKDGKEISVQPKGGNTVVYDSPYTVSKESAGAFSCLYQLKDDNNQENNSLSSDPRYLPVDGGDGSGGDASPQGLGPIVGLAIMAGLALALLGCFLMKTVVSRCRTHREPGPDRSSPAAEDQIQSSAQPNDKLTGAVGRGQERDWLEPGSFCHKLQVCHPHNSHWLRFPANGSCRAGTWGRGSVRSPLAAPMHGSHGGTCRCFQMLHRARAVLTGATRVPFQPGVPSENQTPDNPIQHGQQSGTPWSLEPALTRAQNGRGCCSDVRGGRKGSLSSAGHPDGSVALGFPVPHKPA
ncbi:unnamed protein product [Eretmochelys imbricata]